MMNTDEVIRERIRSIVWMASFAPVTKIPLENIIADALMAKLPELGLFGRLEAWMRETGGELGVYRAGDTFRATLHTPIGAKNSYGDSPAEVLADALKQAATTNGDDDGDNFHL